MKDSEIMGVYNWIFWIVIVISYILKDISPFKQIWNIFKVMVFTIFIILFANFTKKSVKEWWNK